MSKQTDTSTFWTSVTEGLPAQVFVDRALERVRPLRQAGPPPRHRRVTSSPHHDYNSRPPHRKHEKSRVAVAVAVEPPFDMSRTSVGG